MSEAPKKSPVHAEVCLALGATRRRLESYPPRETKLGVLPVLRTLPVKDRRLIGPWCFLDRYGPLSFTDGRPMDVAPHPHMGLQTVTWLLEGEIAHGDSLRGEGVARPGTVNVMTSGDGIAHTERTPAANSGRLSGVQLWVALPDAHRRVAPSFQHVAEVPTVEPPGGGGLVQVFAGRLAGASSPARHHSAIVGADLRVHPGETLVLPLDPGHEHGVIVLGGDAALDGRPLDEGPLHYLGTRREEAGFASRSGARLLLIGGPPFPEKVLMWWNFVARTPEEIVQARADWEEGRRFGEVSYDRPRLAAPALTRLARPNPAS